MSRHGLIIVLSGFPRRSETFAVNELLALKRRGMLAWIFATKHGEDSLIQPAVQELVQEVEILPEDTPSAQSSFIVRRVSGSKISGVHGYFAHTPADVASRVASSLQTHYGFSVHAKDARKVDAQVLIDRASRAACVVACNPDVAQEIRGCGAKLHLLPHGVDLAHFHPAPLPPHEPLRMLAVGRLVEKKGFHVLLKAAARLKEPFLLRIVGEGPEHDRLQSMITDHGLADRVSLVGARTHQDLPREYQNAHLLVAPSVVDQSGDRDGLPNVVLEAMACGRAVVASDAGAISSAVIPGQTGMLVPQDDPDALAAAIHALGTGLDLLWALGHGGRQRAEREYEIGHCTERFCRVLEEAYA